MPKRTVFKPTKEYALSVKSARKAVGVSQAVYGLLFDVTSQTVSNWENARAQPSRFHWWMMMQFRSAGRKHPKKVAALMKAVQEETLPHRPLLIGKLLCLGGC